MSALTVKPESECKYDILSLGEVMIRLDPGDNRIHTTTDLPGLGRRRRV